MKLIPFPLLIVLTASSVFAQVPYPGNDADHGVTRVEKQTDPYTGNVAFSTSDLTVAGAVGDHGLAWRRYATSRTSQTEAYFGLGHNWAHSWQWEMVAAGSDSQGRPVLSVREPQGWVHRFTETSSGQWWPAPSVYDRVISDGDSFKVLRLDAGEVRFVRRHTAGGDVFELNAIVDAIGNLWSFSWENGHLAQVTEPAGRWLKIAYASLAAPPAASGSDVPPFTVITEVVSSDDRKVSYEYTFPEGAGFPVLSRVIYPDGTVANYVYAAPRKDGRLLLTGAVDPHADSAMRGVEVHYRAEPEAASGQLAEIVTADGSGVIQSMAVDARGGRSYAVVQSNGATVYRTFNPGGNLVEDIDALGYASQRVYDAEGRGFMTAITDRLGLVTRFETDANGKVVKTIYPDQAIRSTKFDARGRVLAQIDELGNTTTFTRDEKGRVTKTQRPDKGIVEVTYNDFGQPLTQKAADGAVTTFAYDKRGMRTQVTNALGYSATTAYDSHDQVKSSTDARGNSTRYERDAAGRVIKTVYADGASTATAYDDYGQVTKSIDAAGAIRTYVYDVYGHRTSAFDALGHETSTEYAAAGSGEARFGRPVKTTSATGRVSTTAYDAEGRAVGHTIAAGTSLAATTRTTYDAAGRLASATDARGKTVNYFYDERGRRVRTQSALNHATTVEYDVAGRRVSETDAKGNTTRWTYDELGRELAKTDALDQVTRRAYDAAGRLATLTDAKGNAYRFEYDALGRHTALIYPDGSRETSEYDAAGLKTGYTNRAGISQVFRYDNRNREVSSEWSDGSQKISKAYDFAGRMTREETAVSAISYTFDALGRLASETQDLSAVVTSGITDPVPRVIRYTYTADGQKESLTYPDGSFVRFIYNTNGQLKDILGDGVPPPIASYEYDAAGNATKMPRENDTETIRRYDDENKVADIIETGPRRSPISQLEYEYDEVGNRTATTETAPPALSADSTSKSTRDSYFFDKIYQVTGVDYGAQVSTNANTGSLLSIPRSLERFAYDRVGNRLTSSFSTLKTPLIATTYATNSLNQYTLIGDFMPTHDRSGNLASLQGWSYRYDALNRLVEARSATMTARFYYDAKNRCVARSYNGAITLDYYDNWNLIEERVPTGAQQARYVHGRRIDEIVVMVNKYGVFYPHRDAQGNITMLTDKAGKLVEHYTYSVTGKVAVTDPSGKTLGVSAVGNRWMFTGREWLAEVGLYDCRNRFYSADLGRFMQTDPIRFSAGDINIYRYCFNRYKRGSDPMGLGWWDDLVDTVVDVGNAVIESVLSVGEAVGNVELWIIADVGGTFEMLGNAMYGDNWGSYAALSVISMLPQTTDVAEIGLVAAGEAFVTGAVYYEAAATATVLYQTVTTNRVSQIDSDRDAMIDAMTSWFEE